MIEGLLVCFLESVLTSTAPLPRSTITPITTNNVVLTLLWMEFHQCWCVCIKVFFCIVPVTIECYLNFIKKVTAAKSEEELVSLKQNVMLVDSLVYAGWLKDLTLGNRNLAMQTIMVHFVLHKRKEPFFQLCKGLKTLGVLELVKAFPDLMRR